MSGAPMDAGLVAGGRSFGDMSDAELISIARNLPLLPITSELVKRLEAALDRLGDKDGKPAAVRS